MTTGSIKPGSTFWVWALNALQNSMMFRPRWPSAGPMGGDGFALPAGTWSLIRPTIFFATVLLLSGSNGRRSCGVLPVKSAGKRRPRFKTGDRPRKPSNYNTGVCPLGLLDLAEVQLHRRRAAEDQHRDADLALLVIHLFDVAVEVGERALGHADRLAHLEQH